MPEIISALQNGSQVKVVYSYTQSITANTSTITAELYVHRDSAATSSDSSCSAYININGNRAMTYTAGFSIGSSWVKIGNTCTETVPHNADGTKIVNITGYFNSSITAKLEDLSVSQNITLSTIPRASQLTVYDTNLNIGDGTIVYTNRKSTSFTHALNLYFGDFSTTCAYNVTDDCFFDSGKYEDDLYRQIPNSKSGTGTLRLYTYAPDGSVVGYTEQAVTLSASDSDPTFSGMAYKDINDASVSLTGDPTLIIQDRSLVRVTVTGAAAQHYAAISAYKVQYGSKSVTSASNVINLGAISSSDQLTVTVIDSRGNTCQKSVGVSVVPYSPPVFTAIALNRINDIEAGSTLTCSGSYSNYIVTKGKYSLKFRYKPTSSDTWSNTTTLTPVLNGNSFSFSGNIGSFDISTSYNFEIIASDYFIPTAKAIFLPTAKPVLSLRNGSVGINKIPEKGALDVQGDIYISGSKAYSDGYHPVCQVSESVNGVRFYKGTASGTIATQTAYGSIFYSSDISVSFGATLPSVPTVTTGLFTNGVGYVKIKSVSTSGFVCNLVNAVSSSGVNYAIHWIAAF